MPWPAPASPSAAEHPAVIALMGEARKGETAVDVIRRKCRAMVQRARGDGWIGPPYCPKILASLNRIKVEQTDQDIGGEGTIFPCRGRLLIQYRAGRMIERQRFTICHELAHTCFPNQFTFVRQYHQAETPEEAAYRRFENLCDIGAAELLMPVEDFTADLQAEPPSLARVEALGVRYLASLDAAMKRMLDLTTQTCAAVFLTDRSFKGFSAVRNRLRIKYFWKSVAFKGFLRPGTLLPASVSLGTVPLKPAPGFPQKRSTWWIDGRPHSWYIEFVRLPVIPDNEDYPKVVALLHSRKPGAG